MTPGLWLGVGLLSGLVRLSRPSPIDGPSCPLHFCSHEELTSHVSLLQRPRTDGRNFRRQLGGGGRGLSALEQGGRNASGESAGGENASSENAGGENASSKIVSVSSPVLVRLQDQLRREIAVEIDAGSTAPAKNKIILLLVEVLGLGIWGVDRCYVGQPLLGVAKGLTGGGFLIWALVDYVLIAFNCLASRNDLHALGFRASFESGWQVTACFWLALVLLTVKGLALCFGRSGRSLAWRRGLTRQGMLQSLAALDADKSGLISVSQAQDWLRQRFKEDVVQKAMGKVPGQGGMIRYEELVDSLWQDA